MGLHVVYADERLAQRQGQAFGKAAAYQQGTNEAGCLGVGHSVDFGQLAAGGLQGLLYYWQNVLHMGPAGQFGHYAAILLVHGLGSNDIGQDLPLPANGSRGFVARRLDGEDGNGMGAHNDNGWPTVPTGGKCTADSSTATDGRRMVADTAVKAGALALCRSSSAQPEKQPGLAGR